MEQKQDVKLPEVHEPVVEFKMMSDRIVREVVNADINESLITISGYDLQINVNFEYLKSVEDIDAACEGISTMFREFVMEKLLEYKKPNS